MLGNGRAAENAAIDSARKKSEKTQLYDAVVSARIRFKGLVFTFLYSHCACSHFAGRQKDAVNEDMHFSGRGIELNAHCENINAHSSGQPPKRRFVHATRTSMRACNVQYILALFNELTGKSTVNY